MTKILGILALGCGLLTTGCDTGASKGSQKLGSSTTLPAISGGGGGETGGGSSVVAPIPPQPRQ